MKLTNKKKNYHYTQDLITTKDLAHRMAIKYDLDEATVSEAVEEMFEYIKKMMLQKKIIYVKEFFKLGVKECKAVNISVIRGNRKSSFLYDKATFKFLIPFKKMVKALRGTQEVPAGQEDKLGREE